MTSPTKANPILAALLLICACSSGFSASASAESRWVSDVLYVPLRSGKGNSFRILNRGLKTGLELTFVSEDTEEGWTEVKTASGELGWIRSQYLIDTKPAVLQLATAQKTIERLSLERNKYKEQAKTAKSQLKNASGDAKTSHKTNAKLQQQLSDLKSISGDAVALHERHQLLLENHKIMETELDVIKSENDRLRDDRTMTFFLYGAGSVLLGVLITIILPSLRRKKSYSEWG